MNLLLANLLVHLVLFVSSSRCAPLFRVLGVLKQVSTKQNPNGIGLPTHFSPCSELVSIRALTCRKPNNVCWYIPLEKPFANKLAIGLIIQLSPSAYWQTLLWLQMERDDRATEVEILKDKLDKAQHQVIKANDEKEVANREFERTLEKFDK